MKTLSEQIEAVLRERIAELAPGSKFPTDSELCEEFAVSRMTVYQVVRKLSDEGLLNRHRRRGTFVAEPLETFSLDEESESDDNLFLWLENSNPIRSIFSSVKKKLFLYFEDYAYSFRRKMWDEMIFQIESAIPDVELEVICDNSEVDKADIAMFNLRFPSVLTFSRSPETYQLLENYCPAERYFHSAVSRIDSQKLAARPFAISTDLYIWNRALLEKFHFDFDNIVPDTLIEYSLRNFDWQAADFPPFASFLFYPPLQWFTEGALKNNIEQNFLNIDIPKIKTQLEFNRYMVSRIKKICKTNSSFNVLAMWQLLEADKLMAINTFSGNLRAMSNLRKDQYFLHTPVSNRYAVTVPLCFGITEKCANPEKAVEVLSKICGPVGQKCLIKHYGNIPALRKAAFSDEFLNKSPQTMLQVLKSIDKSESLIEKYPVLLKEQPYLDSFARYLLSEISFDELKFEIKEKNRSALVKQN